MCSIKIRHIKDALILCTIIIFLCGDFKSKYVQGIGALKWKSIIPVNVTYIITVQILHGCGISLISCIILNFRIPLKGRMIFSNVVVIVVFIITLLLVKIDSDNCEYRTVLLVSTVNYYWNKIKKRVCVLWDVSS